MLWATLRLEGAVTWQRGDHISFTCACMCCCCGACVFVHVRPFQAVLEDNVLFFRSATLGQLKHSADLRDDKWNQHQVQLHALHTCPLTFFYLHCVPAGRVSLVRITDLRLEDLQLDDQGLYECRILLLDEPMDELQNGTRTLLSVTGEVYQVVPVFFVFYVCLF